MSMIELGKATGTLGLNSDNMYIDRADRNALISSDTNCKGTSSLLTGGPHDYVVVSLPWVPCLGLKTTGY